MKKYWVHIATFLAGVIAGLIAMYKIMGEQIEVNVKRIKNKRVGSSSTSIPIEIRKSDKRAKTKRGDKKKARLARRLERKA